MAVIRRLISARRQKTEVGHGNCPDMCPEKERYQREVRKQVSPYEGHGGMMDPVKAVKDYSRSAADQVISQISISVLKFVII